MASVSIRCDLGILVQPFSAVGPTALSIKNTEIKVTKRRVRSRHYINILYCGPMSADLPREVCSEKVVHIAEQL